MRYTYVCGDYKQCWLWLKKKYVQLKTNKYYKTANWNIYFLHTFTRTTKNPEIQCLQMNWHRFESIIIYLYSNLFAAMRYDSTMVLILLLEFNLIYIQAMKWNNALVSMSFNIVDFLTVSFARFMPWPSFYLPTHTRLSQRSYGQKK